MLLQTNLPTRTMASHDMVLEIGVALGTLVLAFALVALEEITNSGMIIILLQE